MPIKVRFDKAGFYHPAYGRLGRGRNEGRIYILPDAFGEKETVKIPVMDQTSKPPRQIGEKEITRYRNLPSTVEIISDTRIKTLEAIVETTSGDEAEEATEELEAIKAAARPKVATPEQLEKVAGRGQIARAQSAQERTTGQSSKRRRSKAVAAAE